MRVATIDGNVYQLVFDTRRNWVWFCREAFGQSTPAILYAYDVSAHRLSHWQLPPADYDGFLSRIALTEDGAVWISEPYRVIRFDPITQQYSSLALPLEVAGALPEAYDQSASMPGTWISSIGVDGARVLIARENVPYVVELDRNLHEVGRITVGSSAAGATSLSVDSSGDIVMVNFLGDGRVRVHGENGSERMIDGSATGLMVVGTNVVAIGGSLDGRIIDGATGQSYSHSTLPSPGVVSIPAANGITMQYDPSAGRLSDIGTRGDVLWTWSLPSATGISNGKTVTVWAHLSAITVDDSGHGWVFIENAFELDRVGP